MKINFEFFTARIGSEPRTIRIGGEKVRDGQMKTQVWQNTRVKGRRF